MFNRPTFYRSDLRPTWQANQFITRIVAIFLVIISPVVMPFLAVWETRHIIRADIKFLIAAAIGRWV